MGRGAVDREFGPGRIQIDEPAGFYYPTYSGEEILESGSEYLVVPPSCQCKWINSTLNFGNAIFIEDFRKHKFWIARVQLEGGKVAVGKVEYESNWHCLYSDSNKEMHTLTLDSYGILVCEETDSK